MVRKRLPVDARGQANQFVPLLDEVDQFGVDQIVIRVGFGWLRPQMNSPRFARN